MLTLDGSMGEGGGQILRSALALSMATGTPFHIERIRAGRDRPGLMRQHLTAVLAATQICGGNFSGVSIGSQELSFTPGPVRAGDYDFAVGSAGSTTLVLQTILPVLLTADRPSNIILEGGTHNTHAPPVDFLERAFLRMIQAMGPRVTIDLVRHGFYPAGGGRINVRIEPAPLRAIDLHERGEIVRRTAMALVAGLPRDIGDRELAVVRERLNWPEESLCFRHLTSKCGPGNILTLEIESTHVTELFCGFGQRGISSEAVAKSAVDEARDYLAADVPVGLHLADQLLLPMALAGAGSFTTMPLTLHARTNIQVIESFLSVRFQTERLSNGRCKVSIE